MPTADPAGYRRPATTRTRTRSGAGCWRRFRLFGIRPAKTIISTAADVAGDWWFYLSVVRDNGEGAYDRFILSLLVFAVVGAVMGAIMVLSVGYNIYSEAKKREKKKNNASQGGGSDSKAMKFGNVLKKALALELFVEDIPQFVLTSMISVQRRGVLTPQATFNLTTSGMNFVLNLLDMIEIEEITDDDDNNNNNNNNDVDANANSSGGYNAVTGTA